MITGYGQVTLSSLIIDSEGIATATSTAHGYNKIHTVILIAGADQEAINGEWRITEITNANQIKFDAVESGLINTTITGATITMKIAPLGWAKVYSDEPNFVAVYQSLNPLSRRNFLRVQDAHNLAYNDYGATYFRGYEYMTSAADNGTYPFPPKSVLDSGVFLRKSAFASGVYFPVSGGPISWTIVGNSNQFYFNAHCAYGADNRYKTNFFFGDLVSYVPGDVGATGISGEVDYSYLQQNTINFAYINNYTTNFSPRNSTKTHTTSQQRWKIHNYPTISTSARFLCQSAPINEPDVYSNRMIIHRPLLISDENVSTSIRGEMPGLSVPLNNIISLGHYTGTVLTFNNEKFVYMACTTYSASIGCFLLTLDKDWNVPILQ